MQQLDNISSSPLIRTGLLLALPARTAARRGRCFSKGAAMKKIPLTQGQFALVDDEDYQELNRYKWSYSSGGYAIRSAPSGGGKIVLMYMQRIIAGTPTGLETDHINGDKLNNLRANLRICTTAENGYNHGSRRGSVSGLKGVTFHKRTGKFMARIGWQRKPIYIGLYATREDAYAAYCEAAVRLHGEFVRLK